MDNAHSANLQPSQPLHLLLRNRNRTVPLVTHVNEHIPIIVISYFAMLMKL